MLCELTVGKTFRLKKMNTRSYSELIHYSSFEDRYDYLRLRGFVGESTFGFDRFMNQQFYTSTEWKQIRNHVIARDIGMDLGVDGYEIYDKIIIHHMNPMTAEDIQQGRSEILDPEYLISTTHKTHNAIHYGNSSLLAMPLRERRPGDTNLW